MQGVYVIVNMIDGYGTTYIGSSQDIKARWAQHKYLLGKGQHFNKHLQNAWFKYGDAAFEFDILEEVNDSELLLQREQRWLNEYLGQPTPIYNIAKDTTAPMRGHTFSEEHKRNLSEANKGQVPWTAGKHLSEEHKQKISRANTGKKRTLEQKRRISRGRKGKGTGPLPAWWRQRISDGSKEKVISQETRHKISVALSGPNHPNYGKHLSDETRRKIGNGNRGKRHTEEQNRANGARKAKPYPAFIHRETGAVIPAGVNMRQMCRERGLNDRHMNEVKNKKRRHHKGWGLWNEE